MKYILKEMRITHWIKNLLILVPLAFSGRFFDERLLARILVGFIAFGCMASSIYVINDMNDIEKDRLHPVKCKRPIASGQISKKGGYLLCVVLLTGSLLLTIYLKSPCSGAWLILYFILNLFYSKYGKNIPILDIAILTSGFLIRILYGSTITNIAISNWLYLTVLSMAFYFALGKRRNEKRKTNNQGDGETRAVLKYYPEGFLDRCMYMCLTLANVFYALWSMDKQGNSGKNEFLVWTVPIIMIITMKYSMDVENETWGDPVDVILHDKILILLCVLYAFIMFVLLYIV